MSGGGAPEIGAQTEPKMTSLGPDSLKAQDPNRMVFAQPMPATKHQDGQEPRWKVGNNMPVQQPSIGGGIGKPVPPRLSPTYPSNSGGKAGGGNQQGGQANIITNMMAKKPTNTIGSQSGGK